MSVILKAKKGDKEAFNLLIDEYKVPIYKTAKAILINEEDVCDAIQESLISMYKNIQSLKNEKYFKTWLTRIVINKCYDIIYKQRLNNEKNIKEKEKITLIENYEEDFENTDLEIALRKIDKELREITIMYYYNDLSVKNIADVLNIPTGTVKSRLSRAREKLYEILRPEEVQK